MMMMMMMMMIMMMVDVSQTLHGTADQLGWCQEGQWRDSPMAVPDRSCLGIGACQGSAFASLTRFPNRRLYGPQ